MRNIVKRIVSVGVAAVIGVGMLVGCSSDGKSGSDSSGKDGNMKIGVCIWSTDDGLGADSKEALDFAADVLGVELVYRTGDYDAEGQITAVENLVSAGCEGIMICPIVDTAVDDYLKICENAGVYMQAFFRNIIDEETYEYCMSSDYFTGYVVEDEESAGAAMVDALAEAGCKKFGLINREAGNGVIDRRQEGVADRLKELGLSYEVSTNSSTATAADMTDATDQLLAANPDIDALIVSSGSNGAIDAIVTDIEGTDIKLTSFDTPVDVPGAFKKGNLAMLTTGSQIDPVYALVNLYCTLTDQPKSDTPTEVKSNYIYMTSVEDAELYSKYFSEFKTYTAEEIKALIAMDEASFEKEVATYSLKMVQEKAGEN